MTASASTDRVTIALTGRAEVAKDKIKAHFTETEGLNLMRLGLAYAIRCELPTLLEPSHGRPGDGQTVNVGSFDPNGEIRELMRALYPATQDPFGLVQVLMSRGLIQLDEDIMAGRVTTLADAMYGAVATKNA
ncbi:MAG TPA: hypothetical protein VGK17_09345 [Propionicimonas sp.]